MTRNVLIAYYAATALFLWLDYGYGVNVRIAFLEREPGLRLGFYAVLFGCFLLMLWRPGWSALIGGVESLLTLAALIINMALGSMIVTDAMLETGAGLVTVPELINFMIAGGAAYISFQRAIHALAQSNDERDTS